ncbi:hypothetical protein DSO57_1017945 [Entomophthora muscae]|uniref:Uncharacterized protein n=1 Tax=Entomophthora muscae TaxID=34485 RepID=A0ACC2TRC9_9FUNG|nr:hypothetical protein DSO57_1017945 [Entomophthora muscae]
MSPILFNFASNILLAAASTHIKGISRPGQKPLRALAFADDTVFGLSSPTDVQKFNKMLTLYEKASNAKVNTKKTVVISLEGNTLEPPSGYTTSEKGLVF